MRSSHDLAVLAEATEDEQRVLREANAPICEHKFTHVADVYVRGDKTEFRMRCKNPHCLAVFSVWKDTPDAMRHIRPIGER